jgi:hypothetical protein
MSGIEQKYKLDFIIAVSKISFRKKLWGLLKHV